ncbi:g11445 [Coccomyxa elongata]
MAAWRQSPSPFEAVVRQLDAAPISAHQARHRCGLRSTEGRAEQYQNKDGHITVLHPDSGPIFGGPAVAADSSSRAQEWVDVDAYDALGADASAAWNKGDEMQAWLLQKLHHGLGSAARLQGALAVALKSWPLPDLVSGSASDGSSAGSPRPQVRPGRAAATAAGTDSDAPYPAPTRSGSASFIGALDQNTAGSGLLKPQAERGEAAAVAADPDSWVVLGSDPVFRQPTFEDVPSPLPKIDEEVVLNYLNGIMDENSSDLDTISLSSSADHWMDQAGQQVVQATCSPLGTGPNLPSSAYWKATSDTLDEVLALPAKIHHYTYVDSAQQLQEASTERSQEASTRVQQNKETLRRRAEWTAKWLQDNPTQPRIPRRSWAHSELVTA